MCSSIFNSQNPEIAEKYGLRAGVGLAAPQINLAKQIFAVHIMSYSDGFDGFYLRGPDLKYAVSKIDETNLKNIANQTGLPYTHRQTPDSIDAVVKNGSVDKAVNSSRSFDGYNDIYWIAIFAAAILLTFEIRTIYLPLCKLQNVMPSEGENRE